LQFSSDAAFIQSGKIGRIQANLEADFLKPSTTMRYFPDGKRNCYNLNVEKGRNHLIRARFVYGNYDGRDTGPKFDLYLGPNPWATIDLAKQVNGTRPEIMHIPTSNKLQVCLVKTGETTPLISVLEVRPMGSGTYLTKSGSLKLYYREYFSKSDSSLRYQLQLNIISSFCSVSLFVLFCSVLFLALFSSVFASVYLFPTWIENNFF